MKQRKRIKQGVCPHCKCLPCVCGSRSPKKFAKGTIEIDFADQIKQLKEKKAATKPASPRADETHEEYMKRCTAKGNTREECMKAHEGHTFKGK